SILRLVPDTTLFRSRHPPGACAQRDLWLGNTEYRISIDEGTSKFYMPCSAARYSQFYIGYSKTSPITCWWVRIESSPHSTNRMSLTDVSRGAISFNVWKAILAASAGG